jgi:fatty acid desaturase
MNAAIEAAPRRLFRDREAALNNSLVMAWTCLGWLASFVLMAQPAIALNLIGLLLCVHTMVLAAYLIHEAAHHTLFGNHTANHRIGETMSFIAGASYASFERIRHMHIRHHLDRADLACFDFKRLMQRVPGLRRALEALEWAYLPATELLMHLQVVWRPFLERSQHRYRPRAAAMLVARLGLLTLLGLWSVKALLLYGLAYLLFLHALNFFDAFHHTFDQYFVEPDQALPGSDRTAAYEQGNTYSNLISRRWPWLNLLVLNFGYHNAHHQRASVPWYRLPAYHRELYGETGACELPMAELLSTWHRNRVRRVVAADYGGPGADGSGSHGRADDFIGAHGVSFLTVI